MKLTNSLLSVIVQNLILILFFSILDNEFFISWLISIGLIFCSLSLPNFLRKKIGASLVLSYSIISISSLKGFYALFKIYNVETLELPMSIILILPFILIFHQMNDWNDHKRREVVNLMINPMAWGEAFSIIDFRRIKNRKLTILLFILFSLSYLLLFHPSFEFWYERIEESGVMSTNTVQAILLLINAILKTIGLLIYSSLLVGFATWIFNQSSISKTSVLSRINWLYRILILAFFSFVGIHNINNYWIMIKGLLNVKTILLYYNEWFILWPFKMSAYTIAVFTLYILTTIIFYHLFKKSEIKKELILFILLSISSILFSFVAFHVYSYASKNLEFTRPNINAFKEIVDEELDRQRIMVREEPATFLVTQRRTEDTKEIFNDVDEIFLVFACNLKKIDKYNRGISEVKQEKQFEVCKNEWLTVQFVIVSNEKGIILKKIDFDISNPGIKCDVYKGDYVYCKETPREWYRKNDGAVVCSQPNRSIAKGWVLDPLVPISKDTTLNILIPPMQNRVFFQNIYCPENIKSGLYDVSSKIKIQIKGEIIEKEIKVKLKVLDKKIPKHPNLQTAFSFDPIWINWYYNDSTMFQRNSKKYCNFLLGHKITPTNMYYNHLRFPPINLMDSVLTITGGKLCAGYLKKEYKNETAILYSFQDFVTNREYKIKSDYWYKFDDMLSNISRMDSLGLTEKVYINVFDELKPHEDLILDSLKIDLINSGIKHIPVLSTAEELKSLKGVITYQCPKIDLFDKEILSEAKEDAWAYFCASEKTFPYIHLELPLSEIDSLFNKVKKTKIQGLLYWSINYWDHNLTRVDSMQCFRPEYWNSHSAADLNGDGMLIYPGPKGELYPSIRLLKIRDGLEALDY